MPRIGLVSVAFAVVLAEGMDAGAIARSRSLVTAQVLTSEPASATQTDAFRPTLTLDQDPIFGPESADRTRGGLRYYEEIVATGGWQPLPEAARGLRQGQQALTVEALKTRLAISGDLDNGSALGDLFDAATAAALRRFQARHGLTQTGAVGRLTFAALNVPANVRLNQLRASLTRMEKNEFVFAARYVTVNIPGAVVEAVANGRVERRHLAVVGRKDRPSPVIAAKISAVVANPTWTVPNSIIRKDIMPAVRRDPAYLYKHNIRVLNWKGQEVDPNTVDWSGTKPINFMLREDPGDDNSLGRVKIDMPNTQAVYMHDTPAKELFKSDVRFHSSGCARISDVRDLAAWLLQDAGIDRAGLDRTIETGTKTEIRLKTPVPVAWVYLTAWGDGTGDVQFREDIYGLDSPEGIAATTLARRPSRPASEVPADPVATGSVAPPRPPVRPRSTPAPKPTAAATPPRTLSMR